MSNKVKNILALFSCFIITGVALYGYIQSSFAMSAAETACRALPLGRSRAVCFAKMYANWGIKEDLKYDDYDRRIDNRGTTIDYFNKESVKSATSSNSGNGCGVLGQEWCASFLSYVLRYGFNSWDVNQCSTSKMKDKYDELHTLIAFSGNPIYTGDILYRTRNDGGHVGMVTETYWKTDRYGNKIMTYFQTVEGNTACGAVHCVKYRYYNPDGSPRDADNKGKPNWGNILRW